MVTVEWSCDVNVPPECTQLLTKGNLSLTPLLVSVLLPYSPEIWSHTEYCLLWLQAGSHRAGLFSRLQASFLLLLVRLSPAGWLALQVKLPSPYCFPSACRGCFLLQAAARSLPALHTKQHVLHLLHAYIPVYLQLHQPITELLTYRHIMHSSHARSREPAEAFIVHMYISTD